MTKKKPAKAAGSLMEFASHLLYLSGKFNSVERAVDHINGAIENFATQVNRANSELHGKIAKLEQRVAEVERLTLEERGEVKSLLDRDDFNTKH